MLRCRGEVVLVAGLVLLAIGAFFHLNSLEMTIEGKYNLLPGSGFNEINWETHIERPETPDRIKELVAKAEGSCYVTNTLKKAVKLSGKIFLNGRLLTTTTHST